MNTYRRTSVNTPEKCAKSTSLDKKCNPSKSLSVLEAYRTSDNRPHQHSQCFDLNQLFAVLFTSSNYLTVKNCLYLLNKQTIPHYPNHMVKNHDYVVLHKSSIKISTNTYVTLRRASNEYPQDTCSYLWGN